MRFDAFGTPISSENFWTFLNLFQPIDQALGIQISCFYFSSSLT